jgi:hypothetical protein
MKLHELKSQAEFFESLWSTRRTLELRNNDRKFGQGDVLWLSEIGKEGKPTGRRALLLVMHVLKADDALGLRADFVALSVRLLARTEHEEIKTVGGPVGRV